MDPSQLQPGYRLDRYELLCPLAYGGMASVWLARFGGRLGFERMVVIKMILPQYSQDPRFQEMFLDEARIASKIEHSNVARILDVGEHQDNYFIVMEWVDGDSLSKVLRAAEQRGQRVPLGVSMRIVADAAAGLHAAHELKERDGTHLGVVHRDVSPQNILVANNGTTMIIDFGVAKARDRVSQETSAGQLKGKIRYMAPEQALGRSIDHRADVWALGAMLYEMFTGSPPYDGPNEVATLHKLTSGQRPRPMPPNTPEVLRAVVQRALGYEPHERFSNALELNLALEGAMVEISEPTTTAMVAHYTGQLLTDRKAARKRAVDAALEQARTRDQNQTSNPTMPIPTPSAGIPVVAAQSSRSVQVAQPPELASAPSGTTDANSLQELPSNATLGSANMEYLSDVALLEEGPRRRRYIAAAALGVSVAAGVIGAILIVTAMVKHDPPTSDRAAASGTETASALHAPPSTSEPPAIAAADAGVAPAETPTGTGTVTAGTTTAATTAAAVTAAPATTANTTSSGTAAATTHTDSPGVRATVVHRPTPPPPPPPQQPVVRPVVKTPPTASTSKYGF